MKPEKINVVIGEQIKSLRLKKDWKQYLAAGKIEIPAPDLSKIERGTADMHISRLKKIASVFNVPVTYFFSAVDSAEPQQKGDPEISRLQKLILEKDEKIISIRRKLIDLYERRDMMVNNRKDD